MSKQRGTAVTFLWASNNPGGGEGHTDYVGKDLRCTVM